MLYEIATDGPGWTVDEAPDALAHKLVLPPWLEQHRPQIELRLPTADRIAPAQDSHAARGDPAVSWPHVMLPGTGTPWLLLHGTGADEHDLVPVARELVPTAPIISPRGRVLENGMARWFERYPQGGFNLADYHQRAAELLAWIEEKQKEVPGPWVILGYSNGANIAPQLLRSSPPSYSGCVPTYSQGRCFGGRWSSTPRRAPPSPCASPSYWLGEFDPILPIESAVSLAESLETDGADVEFVRIPTGHGLTPQDLAATQNWIERHRFAH